MGGASTNYYCRVPIESCIAPRVYNRIKLLSVSGHLQLLLYCNIIHVSKVRSITSTTLVVIDKSTGTNTKYYFGVVLSLFFYQQVVLYLSTGEKR